MVVLAVVRNANAAIIVNAVDLLYGSITASPLPSISRQQLRRIARLTVARYHAKRRPMRTPSMRSPENDHVWLVVHAIDFAARRR